MSEVSSNYACTGKGELSAIAMIYIRSRVSIYYINETWLNSDPIPSSS